MARFIPRNIVLILLRSRIIYLANTRIFFFPFSRIVDYVTSVLKHETIEQFLNRVAINKLAWMLMEAWYEY